MADQQATKPADIVTQAAGVAAARQMVTPRADAGQEGSEGIVIKGLGANKHIQETFLLLKGFMQDPLNENAWLEYRAPVMNPLGIGNMIMCLQGIARIDFSNFKEEQIGPYIYKFYKTNFMQFILYAREFDLREEDYNIIKTELLYNCMAAFNNAKNAGHRNVVRATLSENVLLKAFEGAGKTSENKGGLFSWLKNPFKRGQ